MHIFFDLDGTLTDPREGIVACIQYALSALDIAIDENRSLETCIGPPLGGNVKASRFKFTQPPQSDLDPAALKNYDAALRRQSKRYSDVLDK